MTISFDLPIDIEQNLRLTLGNLDVAAKEAMLVELYRQDRVGHYELAQALGLDRFEADAVLKRHNVTEDLLTAEELAEDLRDITQLVSK